MKSSPSTAVEWVPKSVKLLADATPIHNEMKLRLLTDPRMKDVWSYLQRVPVSGAEDRLRNFSPRYDLRSWGCDDAGVSINDQLCGALFLSVVHDWSINHFTSTRAEMDKQAKRWTDAASVCRQSFNESMLSPSDKLLRNCLPDLATHFDELGRMIKNEGNAKILQHSGKDDLLRSRVRSLAQVTAALFGEHCYGILAKVATVALELDPALNKSAIEKWCKGLTPYRSKF